MDRALLTYLLASGPARKFDVGSCSHALDPTMRQSDKLLFSTVMLNHSIIFKYREPGMGYHDENNLQIPMLVFIPYEHERPDMGGESFFFSRRNYESYFGGKTSNNDEIQARLQQDFQILDALSELPTLSPYLVAEQLERRRVKLPEHYLKMPEDLRARMRSRLRQRLRPLVCAAFANTNLKVDLALEEFVELVIDADDLPGLLPLANALRLKPDDALSAFAAWAGITYFEDEFHRIQHDLERFAGWLMSHSMPRDSLPVELKRHMQSNANDLRRNLRDDWCRSREVLELYRSSYTALINEDNPGPFISFLGNASSHYWQMGDILGRLEQLLMTWKIKAENFGYGALPYDSLSDFYYITNRTFVTSHKKPRIGLSGAA